MLSSDKKGLSEMVAYVLLISISISLSVVVFGWLKFYAGGAEVASCPDNVNLIIEKYECSLASKTLTLTLKNKGLFDVDGFVVRVNNRSEAEFGAYLFDSVGQEIAPGKTALVSYPFNASTTIGYLTTITLVDVQPFIKEGRENISCGAYASVKVECT